MWQYIIVIFGTAIALYLWNQQGPVERVVNKAVSLLDDLFIRYLDGRIDHPIFGSNGFFQELLNVAYSVATANIDGFLEASRRMGLMEPYGAFNLSPELESFVDFMEGESWICTNRINLSILFSNFKISQLNTVRFLFRPKGSDVGAQNPSEAVFLELFAKWASQL